jgi:hypothetical protein
MWSKALLSRSAQEPVKVCMQAIVQTARSDAIFCRLPFLAPQRYARFQSCGRFAHNQSFGPVLALWAAGLQGILLLL